MSIRIRTVPNRAKALNEVLAIGCKRRKESELNEIRESELNEILMSVFEIREFQTLVRLAALEQSVIAQEEFNKRIHKATHDQINVVLADIINYIGDDHITLEEAIVKAAKKVEQLIYWHGNAAVAPSYPTEQARLNTRQVNIERAQRFVKRASSRLKESVFSNSKLIYNSQDA